MPKIFLVRKLRNQLKIGNGDTPLTTTALLELLAGQESPPSPSPSLVSTTSSSSVAVTDLSESSEACDSDQPLALSLKKINPSGSDSESLGTSPSAVSGIKYRRISDAIPPSRHVLTPPLAHQRHLTSAVLPIDRDDERCLRPAYHAVSVIQHVPSGHGDFPSSLDSPRIANAPINLSASSYRHRDVYPVSPTPASPFKSYEEINGNGHCTTGRRMASPLSPYGIGSAGPNPGVVSSPYYETSRSLSATPPGDRHFHLDRPGLENSNYNNLPLHYYRVSRPLKDEVSLSSNEDVAPLSPVKENNAKPSSAVMPSLQLRISILQQQLGLPEDAPLEFVNGGHGIKNPVVSHNEHMETMDLTVDTDSASNDAPCDGTDSNRFVCRVCSKVFSLQRLLNRHMKCHSDIKRYLCTFCGKGFNDTFDLKRHTRTHTGVRPYKCNHCEKSFTQRCSLESHTLKVHGIQHKYAYKERRTKVYVCEECGHTTNEPELHYIHLKENHPYSPALLKFYDKRHFKFNNGSFPNMLLQVRT